MTAAANATNNEAVELTRLALARYEPRLIDLSGGRMSAAVLIALYPHDGRYHVLFTKRTDRVEHHKGEISFPGGAEDPGDPDLRSTALRETHEEIGVHPGHVDVFGQLNDFVTRTNFRVRPYVGLITETPYPFRPEEREVAEVLAVPIGHLTDLASTLDEQRLAGDRLLTMRSYLWGDHRIYGATAMILRGFLDLIERAGALDELTGPRVGHRP